MKNLFKLKTILRIVGIISMMLIISFSVVGCKGDDDDDGNDEDKNAQLGTVWKQAATGLASNRQMNAVAYGDGRFFVVGNVWFGVTSTNGIDWADPSPFYYTTANSNNATSIAYGSGSSFVIGGDCYYSGGDTGANFRKDNGEWIPVGTYITDKINGVAWGKDKFVVVGDKGQIAYSLTGGSMSWTKIENSPIDASTVTGNITGVAYGNDRFVAVTNGGDVAYSLDGIAWNKYTVSQAPFSSTAFYCVAYGDGKFVVAGIGGKFGYSTDGTNWTADTAANAPFGTNTIRAITYGEDRFIAVGDGGYIAYSTDGVAWTKISNSSFGTSNIRGVAYGSGRFVAVGDGGKVAYSNTAPESK